MTSYQLLTTSISTAPHGQHSEERRDSRGGHVEYVRLKEEYKSTLRLIQSGPLREAHSGKETGK